MHVGTQDTKKCLARRTRRAHRNFWHIGEAFRACQSFLACRTLKAQRAPKKFGMQGTLNFFHLGHAGHPKIFGTQAMQSRLTCHLTDSISKHSFFINYTHREKPNSVQEFSKIKYMLLLIINILGLIIKVYNSIKNTDV